ncbi:MAG: hypothetical protein ACRCUC_12680 [Aestuariivirga sp.]
MTNLQHSTPNAAMAQVGRGIPMPAAPPAAADSLTTIVNESLNSVLDIEQRLTDMMCRLSGVPSPTVNVKADVPFYGAIEAASNIRNAGRRIQDLVSQLNTIL